MDEQPRLGRVRGVRIFQVGEWKGIPFTEKDLDDAVANHYKFSTGEHKLIDPSLGIGHKREDVLGDGKPRYGTPSNLRKEKMTCLECGGTKVWKGKQCPYCDWVNGRPLGTQTFLTADFEETPEEIGHWISERRFTHCSAEFYPEGSPRLGHIPTKGMALAGVALLGKTAPAVKTLPSLRAAKWETYSDLDCEPFCFSERTFDEEHESSMLFCLSEIMPKGTRVEKCVQDLKAKGGKVNPYAVCQASTHQNLHTGKPITHGELQAHLTGKGLKVTHKGKDELHIHHPPEEVDEKLRDHEYGYADHCMTYTHPDSGYKFSLAYSEGSMQRDELLKLLKGSFPDETLAKFSDEELAKLSEKMTAPPKVIVFNEMMMGDAYKHLTGMGFHAEPAHLHHEGRKHPKETIKLHHGPHDVHRILGHHGYKHHGGGKFVHHTTGHEYHLDYDDEGMPHVHKFSEVPTQGDMDVDPKQVAALVLEGIKPQLQTLVKETVASEIKTFSDSLEGAKKDIISFKSGTHRDALQSFCEEQLKAGRIFAFEMDTTAGLPTIVDRLAKLDTVGAYKFSDGSKEVMLSDLDVAKRDIMARPPRFENSKVLPGRVGGGGNIDADKQKFLAFSDEGGMKATEATETWEKVMVPMREGHPELFEKTMTDLANRSSAA